MKRRHLFSALLLAGGICCSAIADDQSMPTPDNTGEVTVASESAVSQESLVAAELPPFDRVVPEAASLGGPIPTYQKKENLYWELTPSHYGGDYICVISIARGIGTSDLYGGQSIDYGNDMIWRFRKVEDRVQLIRRNYRYRADKGPDSEALRVAFADSIVFSLPIIAKGPKGGDVVDVTSLFMGDSLAPIGASIGGVFARDRSSWEKVKALKDNIELEVAATYSLGRGSTDTIVDARGVSIHVHYSISKMKDSGYQPRLADERIGYFNSAVRDVSKKKTDDNFVRYINRWNLQKLEPNAEVSLPKKPIVYWIDKATPYEYRKTLRDAVLEWNKAFEKAGFYNAVEVRQQEDNDEWDPEDINYNAIRWSSTQTGFSIGPSRVNPETGEILDADVVLSVGFLSSWTRQFELYKPEDLLAKFTGRQNSIAGLECDESWNNNATDHTSRFNHSHDQDLFYAQQFGLANAFFDMMTVEALDAIDATVAVEEEPATSEPSELEAEEQKKIAEAQETATKATEAASKAAELAEQAKAELQAVKEQLEQAKAEGGEKFEKLAAEHAALEKKAQDAQDVANSAKSVADDAANRLAQVEAFINELKAERQAAEEKKVAEAKEKEAKAAEEKLAAEKRAAAEEAKKKIAKEKEKLIDQGLRQLVTHEIGHTLGLRHNFIQSTLHTLDEINDASKWTEHGFVGSIMEYAPVNIMPKGEKQGDYFSYRLGEYDELAIEYGYRVFGKSTEAEKADLEKIASKQSLPQYKFATDEDCYGSTVNPYVNIWDLGSSPLEYAKLRVRLVEQLLPGLNERVVKDGESYDRIRTRFNMLNNWKVSGMVFAANYIGGMLVNRDFKGDENAQKPFSVVPAKDQREAAQFLAENCFGVNAYKVPKELFDYLAPNRWRHWGSSIPDRYDYDVHSNILTWQTTILNQLLSTKVLGRLIDAEMRVPEGEDVFSSAELLTILDAAIYQELNDAVKAITEGGDGKIEVKISSVRRNLQRAYLDVLMSFATSSGSSAGFRDMVALARVKLMQRNETIEKILGSDRIEFKNANGRGDDAYGRAYLIDSQQRIKRSLDPVKTVAM